MFAGKLALISFSNGLQRFTYIQITIKNFKSDLISGFKSFIPITFRFLVKICIPFRILVFLNFDLKIRFDSGFKSVFVPADKVPGLRILFRFRFRFRVLGPTDKKCRKIK